jgi:hypothetical protein
VVGREQDYIDWLGDGPGPGGLISRLYAANGVLNKTSLLAAGMVINRYTLDDGYDLSTVFDRDDVRANMRRDLGDMIRFAEPGEDDSVFSAIHRQLFAWSDGSDADDVRRIAARFRIASGVEADGDTFAPLNEALESHAAEIGVHVVNILTAGPSVVLYCECEHKRLHHDAIDSLVQPVRDRLSSADGDSVAQPTIFRQAFRWVANAEERALAK